MTWKIGFLYRYQHIYIYVYIYICIYIYIIHRDTWRFRVVNIHSCRTGFRGEERRLRWTELHTGYVLRFGDITPIVENQMENHTEPGIGTLGFFRVLHIHIWGLRLL